MARMLAAEPAPLSAGMRAARESLGFAAAPAAEAAPAPLKLWTSPRPFWKPSTPKSRLPSRKRNRKRKPRWPPPRPPPKRPPRRSPRRRSPPPGLTITRRYTRPGESVWDTCEWELRTASIVGSDGQVVFEQKRRRDPQGLVPARHQRRRLQILPGPRRHPGARVQRQAADRPRRRPHPGVGQAGRLLRLRRGRRGLPRRTALHPPAPDGRLQLPRLVQPRLAGTEAGCECVLYK